LASVIAVTLADLFCEHCLCRLLRVVIVDTGHSQFRASKDSKMALNRYTWTTAALAAAALMGCDSLSMNSGYNSSGTGSSVSSVSSDQLALNKSSGWVKTSQDSLSTFAADVDGGSYTLTRSKILSGTAVDAAQIRPEEFINYFEPGYEIPTESVFGVSLEVAPSLWRSNLHVLRVGIQGRVDSAAIRAPWNVTFLVDLSGSMEYNLPLVKSILNTMVDNMRTGDILSIAAFDATPYTILEPTSLGDGSLKKDDIRKLIAGMSADNSTNMEDGIVLGYQLNDKRKLPINNRVVVISDGGFNVGITSASGLLGLVNQHIATGTTISTLGVGVDSQGETEMEALADKGNGNYFYIDTDAEAMRVVGTKLGSTMTLIARDLKIQVAFNSDRVESYRLIGYENRTIKDEDFSTPTTDGGEIGSGHHVTALYELKLKAGTGSLGEVRLRYKDADPTLTNNNYATRTISNSYVVETAAGASQRMQFTECVAEFAERLRNSPWASTSYPQIYTKVQQVYNSADTADVGFVDLARRK
jgi:Ca-activated chloride channel homolog